VFSRTSTKLKISRFPCHEAKGWRLTSADTIQNRAHKPIRNIHGELLQNPRAAATQSAQICTH
jgi:hypothetical protein